MLLPREDVQKILKEEHTANWLDLCLSAIKNELPASSHAPAYALLSRDAEGKAFDHHVSDVEARQRYHEEIEHNLQKLAALTSEERTAIFAALVPRLAAPVEAAWQLLGRFPYQVDTYRRAFRAPAHEQAYRAKRLAWVRNIVPQLAYYREKDLAWFAAWAAHLAACHTQPFGILFAAAIDAGGAEGEEIFAILVAAAHGEHEIAKMGRHVTTGLLAASRPDGWECIERLLLAAQREEGLRQVILETVDEAHPQAFRRMIRLILEHDLLRFSATVRAADVWFGFARTVEDVSDLRHALRVVVPLLDEQTLRNEAIASGNPQEVYLALWASAFTDAHEAMAAALPILNDPLPERRLAATHLLSLLNLPETQTTFLALLADPDLRVALHAFASIKTHELSEQHNELFEQLQRLLERIGQKSQTIQSGIWPWLAISSAPAALLSTMLQCLAESDPRCLLPHLPLMNAWDKIELAKKLAALPVWDEEVRNALYTLVGERTQWVSARVRELFAARPLDETDRLALEQFLTRKGIELRRSLLALLLIGEDETVLSSASRLLAQANTPQRLAGLDLLNGLISEKRQTAPATSLARAYQESHTSISPAETALLETIFAASQTAGAPTRENVLGLIEPQQRTPVVPPRSFAVTVDTPAARECLRSLDALIEEQRETPVLIKTWRGHEEMLLGNVNWQFPAPDLAFKTEEDEREHLPLSELWLKWERKRPAALRDEDGLELFRAELLLTKTRAAPTVRITTDDNHHPSLHSSALTELLDENHAESTKSSEPETIHLRHSRLIDTLLVWLRRRLDMSPATLNFLFDCAETALASINVAKLVAQETDPRKPEWQRQNRRYRICTDGGLMLLQQYRAWHGGAWEAEHLKRHWQLLHWLDQPAPGLERSRPSLEILLSAYEIGAATEADIFDQLGGPVPQRHGSRHFTDLRDLSAHTPHQQTEKYPILNKIVGDLRARVLEIELRRGEMPTEATDLALALRYSGATAVFVRLLALLTPTELARGYNRDNQGKATTWSHLLRVSAPDPDETPEEFARQVRDAHLTTEHLIAAALYAPQWAKQVEYVLGWLHFVDAVWWIYAHTRGSNWSVDDEIRKTWQAQVAERTVISADELLAGAVDVAWFQNSYNGLGAERWEHVYAAAKYASDGTGHGRARLYADAMSGRVDTSELHRRMSDKRQQDAVRAAGLVPLPVDESARTIEIAERYQAFQEFKRSGQKFGAQRKASEEMAIRIGMENLARTAGFSDPLRLQWAMEAQTASDLRTGTLTVTVDEVTLTLALDAISAEPEVTIVGGKGKVLKTLPTRLKKQPEVVRLFERKREIEQQIKRTRGALETAMCRGDRFTAREILELLAHPIISRLLQNLIFVYDADKQEVNSTSAGYPFFAENGTERQLFLRDYAGNTIQVNPAVTDLRLAHPHDLLSARTWHAWQHECFTSQREQPFKQVFRELYVCTSNERRNGDDALSQRYSGHQVQPRQAHALLGQRGWITDYYEGVRRTFHAEQITATVSFGGGIFTPTEVEGLTVGDVSFTPQGAYKPMPLTSVPPRVFSETMRDLDLMVSVAHSGGVDPETTTSTVEMRAALVSETCALLGLANVAIKSAHALIAGTLGQYSVHLGSAVVHRQPGGALCIIPVHAQQRGRIFLPFADNDPKTAEVITKIITLARDNEIKDPSILEQLL